jgi:glucose-1-phosphate thymidylyltransferase
MFTSSIFDAGKAIEPSGRGELEITDAIQHLVDSGLRVDSHVVHGWWKDTGQVQDMLDANRLILDEVGEHHGGTETDSKVEGRVHVSEGAVVERSTIRGPAVIGSGARVVDSYIGPYTAIGDDCVVENSEVEHSIVLAGSAIRDLPGRIEASLIGRDVSISRTEALPRVFRFVVGDGSDITIL